MGRLFLFPSFQFVVVLGFSSIGQVAAAKEIEQKSYIIFAALFAISIVAFVILVAVIISI